MKHNKYTKFKSFTDINNYNTFLAELDKKQTTKNDTSENNVTKSDLNITQIINNIESIYNKLNYNSNNFTGRNVFDKLIDKLETVDPNASNSACCVIDPKYKLTKNKTATHNDRDNYKPIKEEIAPIITQNVSIQAEINNIEDLLKLIEKYPDDRSIKYNINMKALHKIKEPLTELNNMIGMKNLKENIVDQILFFVQNLHRVSLDSKDSKDPKVRPQAKVTKDKKTVSNDFMHTVIYGPPGTGKTEIAKIIGKIFAKIGVLEKGTFKKVTRSDLIAGYLGQTAIKTTEVIKECLGGVLFIDEAYALGCQDKRDSFSKECIDTLCEALSNHKENLMVIVAGYETDLNECFFNYNQGLNSRFTWRFKTDDYSAEDLYKIFIKKVNDESWTISENETDNVTLKWFEKHKATFKFYGRDIETLFAKVKIAHSRRVFCLDETEKKRINIKDVNKGLEMFLKNENSSVKKAENMKQIISSMYI
jgi:SpoVK/Ycf46/Vps4 family AAA+-type ATPase